jgi:hypothetical protein
LEFQRIWSLDSSVENLETDQLFNLSLYYQYVTNLNTNLYLNVMIETLLMTFFRSKVDQIKYLSNILFQTSLFEIQSALRSEKESNTLN